MENKINTFLLVLMGLGVNLQQVSLGLPGGTGR